MKRRTLIGWAVALVTGIGAECGAKPGTPVDPNVPPDPKPADADWTVGQYTLHGVRVSTWVEPEFCPYTVTIDARNLTTGEKIQLTDKGDSVSHKINGGQYSVPASWVKGDRCEITVSVQAAKPGSQRGYIVIRERPRYSQSATFGGTAKATLTYTSKE